MAESFGDEFRNKQQLDSENIDKEKLDEIVQAAKDEVNKYKEVKTYLDNEDEKLTFNIPKLSETQLAYIAKQLDMHVTQIDDNSIKIICDKRPDWNEYLKFETKLTFFVMPQLIAIGIIVMMGSMGGICCKVASLYGGLIILAGVVCGMGLAFSNNRFVRKSIDDQINNEILNKQK